MSKPRHCLRPPPSAADPIPGEVPTPARPRVLHDILDPTNTDSPLPERTALQLAKQVRKCSGCTHEEHAEAEGKHQTHHRRPDVRSEYFSIPGNTSILRGSHAGRRLLPDVLSNSNSVGFACRGVDWFPRVYPLLKLTADIHFVRRGMGWVRLLKSEPNQMGFGLGWVIVGLPNRKNLRV